LKWPSLCGILALALSPGVARADKLIWIPTAGISRLVQAEFMTYTNGNQYVATGQIGLGKQFELLIRHYHGFEHDDSTEVGGQFTVLPEGFATPGVAVGVWDVADDGPRGRRIFAVVSKTVPLVHQASLGLTDLKLHAGIGSNRLSGIFLGGELGLPAKFAFYAEYDARDFNAGLSWTPISLLRLKVESWDGHVFAGAQLRSPL